MSILQIIENSPEKARGAIEKYIFVIEIDTYCFLAYLWSLSACGDIDALGDVINKYENKYNYLYEFWIEKIKFTKSEKDLESKSEKYGSFVISKPVDENILKKSLHFLRAMRQKLGGVQKENVKLKKQIDNIRLINRAKYILMEYLSMTEPQAHRYLEKQAMDLRITKAEVAKRLLSTYEN